MPDTRSNPPADPPAVRRSGDADDQITLSSHRPTPGQIVIEVGGEVDMLTSPQLRAAVLEQFEPSANVELVVLGMDGVTFLGTSGLAVLIEVREAAHSAGRRAAARLRGPSGAAPADDRRPRFRSSTSTPPSTRRSPPPETA